jgi:hypothetical protein
LCIEKSSITRTGKRQRSEIAVRFASSLPLKVHASSAAALILRTYTKRPRGEARPMPETENHDAGSGGERGDVPKGQLLRAVLSQPVRRSALRHLLLCGSSGLDGLADELGVTVRQVSYHVGILRSHGLATGTGDPRGQADPSCFVATCKEEAEVARRLSETDREDREALRERHLAATRPWSETK